MTAITPSRSGVSPSSSPRLPSPPPIPEVQFGPKSPGIDLSKELSLDATSKPDEGAARRIRPGTKAADMALGPPLVPLNQLESAFQYQEHLKSLYSQLTHTEDSTHTIPITKVTAMQLATPPQLNENDSVERNLWLYELCRFLTQKANIVSIYLMNDNPPCSSATCPEMRASEWQYLCAVHEPPKSCCAIDYCNHTLDWAANVLTSPKHFHSRLALVGEAGNAIQSMRQLTNIFRRVYRIFAHAWFQHRDVFWSVEATYGLYMLFKVVCDEYHLIPEDSYTIPPEAEGAREVVTDPENQPRPQILRKDASQESSSEEPSSKPAETEDSTSMAPTTVSTGATTRRHKHTPSTGSHVSTIAEGQEEDEDQPSSTISTKPNSTPGIPQLVEAVGVPSDEDSRVGLPPKYDDAENAKAKDPSPNRLPKLDIAATVPKYEPRAPEDPTPTGISDDVDPLSSHDPNQSSSGQGGNDNTNSAVSKGQAAALHVLPDTPIDQVTKPFDDDEAGQKITSPSGGSIRTGGSDVLAAIMGHIHDAEDEDEDASPHVEVLQQQQSTKLAPSAPLSEGKQGDDEAENKDDDEGNESMSPVEATAPSAIHEDNKNDDQSGDMAQEQQPDEVKITVESLEDDDDDDHVEQSSGPKEGGAAEEITSTEP